MRRCVFALVIFICSIFDKQGEILDVAAFGPWAQRPGACRVSPSKPLVLWPRDKGLGRPLVGLRQSFTSHGSNYDRPGTQVSCKQAGELVGLTSQLRGE